MPTRKAIGDREAYLGFTIIIWIGILTGFVPETLAEGFNYPAIVHLHALVFVGWLVLLTVQCLLIRSNRQDLHRKLGIFGAVMAVAVLVIGPETALVMDRLHHAENGKPPIFLSVQMADLVAFAGLMGAGLMLRKRAQLHKTLVLLATICLSVAGFARGAGRLLAELFPQGPVQFYEHIYGGTDILMLALGIYQIAHRRTPNPAFFLGCTWIVALHVAAVKLYFWPDWQDISLRIIGG